LNHFPTHNVFKVNTQPSIARKSLSALALLLAFLGVPTAWTQDRPPAATADADGIRASYSGCIKAADGVTPRMQDCIGNEYEYQDKRLNLAYKALMNRLNKAQRTELRAEERKWLAQRDKNCALPPDAGQGQRVESNDCFMEQAAKRAAILEAHLREN